MNTCPYCDASVDGKSQSDLYVHVPYLKKAFPKGFFIVVTSDIGNDGTYKMFKWSTPLQTIFRVLEEYVLKTCNWSSRGSGTN